MVCKMISQIVKKSLCTGCGTCVGMCEQFAIEMIKNVTEGIYVPTLDGKKCNQCGICLKVCPGNEIDIEHFNIKLYGKKPENVFTGNYINCYSGHSTNYDVRYNSSSGGLVTQLLIFALESGIIDGVLVTRMNKNNPLDPEPFIATKRDEIIEASKSKYCPVPTNIAIREILDSDMQLAVVGLPCHIHGFRKAEQLSKKLDKQIVLHIGIFCAYTINFNGTDFLLEWSNIEKNRVEKLAYRGNGWPGAMSIKIKNNENLISIPSQLYWGRFFGDYGFAPKRCLACSDVMCELSDISFGDAWLPEFSKDKCGTSIIVARTEYGKQILQNAHLAGVINLNEIPIDSVIQSQQNILYFKKKNIKARLLITGTDIKYDNILNANLIDYIIACYICLNQRIYSRRKFERIVMNTYINQIMSYYKLLFGLIYSKIAKFSINKEMSK